MSRLRRLKALPGDQEAATAVEFAMVGLLFIVLIIGIFELGWMFWVSTALQMTASDTARGNAIGSGATSGSSSVRTDPVGYAVSLAKSWGVAIGTSNVSEGTRNLTYAPAGADTCAAPATTGGVQVTWVQITYTYTGVIPPRFIGLPAAGKTITINACYPQG